MCVHNSKQSGWQQWSQQEPMQSQSAHAFQKFMHNLKRKRWNQCDIEIVAHLLKRCNIKLAYNQDQMLLQHSRKHSVQHKPHSIHPLLLVWAAVSFAFCAFWFKLLFADCGWFCIVPKSIFDKIHQCRSFFLLFSHLKNRNTKIFSPSILLSIFTAHISNYTRQ